MCRKGSWVRSPTIPPTSRRPSSSAGHWPTVICCACRGRRNSAAAGASVWEQTVVREEMWAHHEPRGAQYMGVNWVGPIIMRHGTEEQQRKHLPPIARGEVIWCQGFSEPEAGSDLASLRTAARPRRRRLAGQRPEDLDLVRHDGAVVLPARTNPQRGEEAAGPDDLPGADGRSGDPGQAHPLHDGPASPQRGVLRRPAGHPSRCARRGRRRMVASSRM